MYGECLSEKMGRWTVCVVGYICGVHCVPLFNNMSHHRLIFSLPLEIEARGTIISLILR